MDHVAPRRTKTCTNLYHERGTVAELTTKDVEAAVRTVLCMAVERILIGIPVLQIVLWLLGR